MCTCSYAFMTCARTFPITLTYLSVLSAARDIVVKDDL